MPRNRGRTYLPLSGLEFLVFVVFSDGFWAAALYGKLVRYRRFYRRAGAEGRLPADRSGAPAEREGSRVPRGRERARAGAPE